MPPIRTNSFSAPPRVDTSTPKNVSSPSSPVSTPKSPTTGPASPAADARPATLRREDNYFTDSEFKKNEKTNQKAYLDNSNPANPTLRPVKADGTSTPLQHVQGGINEKANSPYTSFTPGTHQSPKSYGKYEVEVNKDKLVQDINSGKLPGVQVLDNKQVQQGIQDDIKKRTGVEVKQPIPHADIPAFVSAQGLSKKKEAALTTRLTALANTSRDNEVLVKGNIPSEYIRRVGLNRDEYAKLTSELQTKVNGQSGGPA